MKYFLWLIYLLIFFIKLGGEDFQLSLIGATANISQYLQFSNFKFRIIVNFFRTFLQSIDSGRGVWGGGNGVGIKVR